MARKSRQVETRMISEYLKENYDGFTFILNVPLGSVSEDLMREEGYKRAIGLSRPFRPIADAVVILPSYLLLVEAKVWNVVNGLAKLPLYKSLVPITPELKEYMPRGTLMQLVVGWTNPNLQIMARAAGVELKVYRPLWLEEVVESQHRYWTREYRDQREKRLQMREFFGVD
uniref:Nuclease n=1 Tax=viral metagenome TaxID=1070528 RepID=A0A6M3XLH3_9ZZZZ